MIEEDKGGLIEDSVHIQDQLTFKTRRPVTLDELEQAVQNLNQNNKATDAST